MTPEWKRFIVLSIRDPGWRDSDEFTDLVYLSDRLFELLSSYQAFANSECVGRVVGLGEGNTRSLSLWVGYVSTCNFSERFAERTLDADGCVSVGVPCPTHHFIFAILYV